MGKKYRLLILPVLILLIFSASLFSALENEVEVISLSGKVYYRSNVQSAWEVLKAGDRLRVGTEIRTEEHSGTELNLENVFVRLDPGTHLVIKKLERSENTLRIELTLVSGTIWSKVVKVLGNLVFYEVTTPTAVAGVEGTLFDISYQLENTEILVAEGLVKVKDNFGRELLVGAMEKVKVTAEGIFRLRFGEEDQEVIEQMRRWGFDKESTQNHAPEEGTAGNGNEAKSEKGLQKREPGGEGGHN